MIRKPVFLLSIIALAVMLSGWACSNGTQMQQVAAASKDAMDSLKTFQTTEISLYDQGVIPLEDHRFILEREKDVAAVDKALNVCILAAGQSNQAVITCLDNAIGTVNELQARGAFGLKSEKAKSIYNWGMFGVTNGLVVIKTILGAPPPTPGMFMPIYGGAL